MLVPMQMEQQVRRLAKPDHFIAAFVLSLLLLVTIGWISAGFSGRLLVVVLLGVTIVYAFYTSGTSARTVRVITALVSIVTLVLIVTDLLETRRVASAISLSMEALLVIATPLVIARRLLRHRFISVQTIAGALCVYVLFGLFFAVLYHFVDLFTPKPFFEQTPHASSADFVYFSFVSLTTVGYGDLTTADGLGRMLAVTEALLGQFYLVTVIALLVSNIGRARDRPDEPSR
jgi:hypothetical protein